jgi:hypothetical protein
MATVQNHLDRYFDPVVSVFTPELAEKIVSLQPEQEAIDRVNELGDKANEGALTDDERAEYKDYVDAGDFIALLKAKARRYLANQAE